MRINLSSVTYPKYSQSENYKFEGNWRWSGQNYTRQRIDKQFVDQVGAQSQNYENTCLMK